MASIDPFAALTASAAGSTKTASDPGSAERFLKLLVTQMQNQDPLNPMDNAQITSQLAQINTVSGIETLNTSVQGLNSRFAQMQALQGVSLVGREITLKGDALAVSAGQGDGGFDLAGTADRVKVEILSPAGRVVDTLELGTLASGRHAFNWQPASTAAPADGAAYRFRVVPTSGAAAVGFTPLMRDRVEAVSTAGERLTLQTQRSGSVPYSDVLAFN